MSDDKRLHKLQTIKTIFKKRKNRKPENYILNSFFFSSLEIFTHKHTDNTFAHYCENVCVCVNVDVCVGWWVKDLPLSYKIRTYWVNRCGTVIIICSIYATNTCFHGDMCYFSQWNDRFNAVHMIWLMLWTNAVALHGQNYSNSNLNDFNDDYDYGIGNDEVVVVDGLSSFSMSPVLFVAHIINLKRFI